MSRVFQIVFSIDRNLRCTMQFREMNLTKCWRHWRQKHKLNWAEKKINRKKTHSNRQLEHLCETILRLFLLIFYSASVAFVNFILKLWKWLIVFYLFERRSSIGVHCFVVVLRVLFIRSSFSCTLFVLDNLPATTQMYDIIFVHKKREE